MDVTSAKRIGTNVAINSGKSPVRLLKAELLPVTTAANAKIVTVRVDDILPPMGGGSWPSEYSAPETTKELNGYLLVPGKNVGVVFVVEPTAIGSTRWTKTRLTYVENGKTRVTVANNGLTVCAPFDLGKPCTRRN